MTETINRDRVYRASDGRYVGEQGGLVKENRFGQWRIVGSVVVDVEVLENLARLDEEEMKK